MGIMLDTKGIMFETKQEGYWYAVVFSTHFDPSLMGSLMKSILNVYTNGNYVANKWHNV
jgi:hypothetical protein